MHEHTNTNTHTQSKVSSCWMDAKCQWGPGNISTVTAHISPCYLCCGSFTYGPFVQVSNYQGSVDDTVTYGWDHQWQGCKQTGDLIQQNKYHVEAFLRHNLHCIRWVKETEATQICKKKNPNPQNPQIFNLRWFKKKREKSRNSSHVRSWQQFVVVCLAALLKKNASKDYHRSVLKIVTD